MGIFDRLRTALTASAPTASDLAETVKAAEGILAAAQADQARLRGERPAMLVADDATRAKHKKRVAEVDDQVEDAREFLAALQGKLADLRSTEAEARRLAAYASAKAQIEAAAKAVREEYPEIGRRFRDLLRVVAEADLARAAANADLPRGAEPLRSPEAVARTRPAAAREVVSESIVEKWCRRSDASPLPVEDELQDKIVPVAGSETFGRVPQTPRLLAHTVRHEGGMRGGDYVLRRFKRIEILPARPGAHPSNRLTDIDLPGLTDGNPPFWRHQSYDAGPQKVLDDLSSLEAWAASEQPRKPVIEFELLPLESTPAAPPSAKAGRGLTNGAASRVASSAAGIEGHDAR